MKSFVSASKHSGASKPALRTKKHYIEIELPYENDPSLSYFLYVVVGENGESLIVSCWDQVWNEADNLDQQTLANYLPGFYQARKNLRQQRSGKNQMAYLADPKDGVQKWMLVRDVNIDLSMENPLDDPALGKGLGKILKSSKSILGELIQAQEQVAPSAPVNRQQEEEGLGFWGKALIGVAAGLLLGVDVNMD